MRAKYLKLNLQEKESREECVKVFLHASLECYLSDRHTYQLVLERQRRKKKKKRKKTLFVNA